MTVVQRSNTIAAWLFIGFVVTWLAAMLVPDVPDNSHTDAGGLPLGIPNAIPCPCGARMQFTLDDQDRPLYQCPKCGRKKMIPVR